MIRPATEYECRLRQLHALIANGEGDSEGAEMLRDEMEAFGSWMTPGEVREMKELSAALYMEARK